VVANFARTPDDSREEKLLCATVGNVLFWPRSKFQVPTTRRSQRGLKIKSTPLTQGGFDEKDQIVESIKYKAAIESFSSSLSTAEAESAGKNQFPGRLVIVSVN